MAKFSIFCVQFLDFESNYSQFRVRIVNLVLYFKTAFYVQVDRCTGNGSFATRKMYKIQPRIPDLYLKRGFSYLKRPYYRNVVDMMDDVDEFDFSSTDSFDSNGEVLGRFARDIRHACRQEYHGMKDGVLRRLAVERSDEETLKEVKRLGKDFYMKKRDYEQRLDEEKKQFFVRLSKN